ncbi:isocitrate lyase/PEP mutase family protein [Robertmurraya kyonggiensis]|uniref:2-methylisocitrate lyase n=1 Tax=Robertmurraya kyonggiensis TaxID=1037680 RepID=A0A4U1D663_9BACI|nr:isocitrate lyase/PEP mutase family protein [Robertmurraya kyonggiensis]TKC18011.1 isocitrate lyase/PEP mutase family protein [Robertmurraya kyonggiensis]
MRKTTKFKELINQKGILVMPGGFDGMSARLIEETGFKAMLATGAGISNSQLGIADVGLTTMTEVAQQVTKMTDVTNIPILADMDTGYGNAINVIRSVKEFERAGAAGIQIEDQLAPKKCGHFAGKQVISKEEMVHKIKAIVDTRQDPDLVIVARTDARAIHGIDDALDRAHAYAEAGADVTFVEAPQSLKELERIATELKGIPQMANMVEGGLTPLLSAQELEQMGFKIMICANTALRAAVKGIKDALTILQNDGDQAKLQHLICTWEERQTLFRLHEVSKIEDKYLRFTEEVK